MALPWDVRLAGRFGLAPIALGVGAFSVPYLFAGRPNVALVLLGSLALALLDVLGSVRWSAEGLTFWNVRRHRISWSDVGGFHVGSGAGPRGAAPLVWVDLNDGRSIRILRTTALRRSGAERVCDQLRRAADVAMLERQQR